MMPNKEMSCALCDNNRLCAAYRSMLRFSRELSSIPIWRGHCFPAVTEAEFRKVFQNVLAENCEEYKTTAHT